MNRPTINGWYAATMFLVAVGCLLSVGCRIGSIDSARRLAKVASLGTKPVVDVKRKNNLQPLGPISRLIASRERPSERTQLFLRIHNLSAQYERDPESVVEGLHQDCLCEPDMESVHAIAELSEIEANWNLKNRAANTAAKFYAAAAVHSYQFLFDPKLNLQRNAYDPQFREICDIYNSSLEQLLKLVCDSEEFKPGTAHLIGDESFKIEMAIEIDGRWSDEQFERFELVNDFEIDGIDNQYRTFGLGVPLIAIRKPKPQQQTSFEKYYPPSLSLPLTAFWEVDEFSKIDLNSNLKAVLRLYDPLERTVVQTETRHAPLESDLTVPLAYYLNDPLLNTNVLSTVGLLNAQLTENYFGFYMLEPFDPDKIPVVMVHGLWSIPVTWMKMFNDLRSNESIRENYQFWFYMYPTGQPFWFSAHEMRQKLVKLRQDIDPDGQSKHLKEMVLIGHSMGGLLSRMQTIDSGEDFWKIVSDHSIDQIRGDPQIVAEVKDLFYFEPDPNIETVITIASPHRGSRYANTATQWLSHQLFRLPNQLTRSWKQFCELNEDLLHDGKHVRIPTSVDSLSPNSPFIQRLVAKETSPAITMHNIVGNFQPTNWIGKLKHVPGDGVVSLESAHLQGAISEIEVAAEHQEVHQHPQAILEVERILMEKLRAATKNAKVNAVQQATMLQPILDGEAKAKPPVESENTATIDSENAAKQVQGS